MTLTLIAGTSNRPLAEATARKLGTGLASCHIERFPDGEIEVRLLQSVRGSDVYLLQSTSPPVESHLLELLFLADAARRAGARRLTAVIPYFGYARQDRRARGREPVGARVVAGLFREVAVDRVIAIDLHTPSLEGFFPIPLEHLTAVPLLRDAVKPRLSGPAVLVAPDLGASRLAERYAGSLELPTAIVHKIRRGGGDVRVRRITGDVRDRMPVIVDDMIATGGTIEAAVVALREAGSAPEVVVAATHSLLVGPARKRLAKLGLRALLVTDSVSLPSADGLPLQFVRVDALLAEAIRRMHGDESLHELIVHD